MEHSLVDILNLIFKILMGFLSFNGIYHMLVGSCFWYKIPQLPEVKEKKRFLIISSAKDEAKVIGSLIDSLLASDYDRDRFDVAVIADNCTDNTAEVAQRHGAKVFEHFDPIRRSKGHALNWFFQTYRDMIHNTYDACIVFDADNVVDKDFIKRMNEHLVAGHKVAVGKRLGKNPDANYVAGCSSIFWMFQSRYMFRPRMALKLSCCSVCGTGFMFDLSALKDGVWRTSTLCEDVEFTMQQIIAGRKVYFEERAVCYDEQPTDLKSSIKQRYRWVLGNIQVSEVASKDLLKSLLHGNFCAFDALMNIWGTYYFGVSVGIFTLYMFFKTFLLHIPIASMVNDMIFTAVSYLFMVGITAFMLHLDRKDWKGTYTSVLLYPFHMLVFSLLSLVALFYRDTTWHQIRHDANVSIEEMQR